MSFLAQLRDRIACRRARAYERFRQDLHCDRLLKSLCQICDHGLRELLDRYPLPRQASLAALGGYGRGELYPHSDVDLLILLQRDPNAEDIDRIQTLVAALWDIGLAPSHNVATPAQCLEQASQDITTETALLESRWLAGSKLLLRHAQQQLQSQMDPQAFFLAKQAEQQQRHAHLQDTPYSLEPNCKESPGALRDLQVLLWMARAAGLGRTWVDVAQSELLTESELKALQRVEEAFKRLRIELHLLTGRAEDRLLFDLQPRLAEIYGFQPTATRRASELLMQRYYWAAKIVSQLNLILMRSIEEHLFPQTDQDPLILDSHFQIHHGQLELRQPDGFEQDPSLIFVAMLHLQQQPNLRGLKADTLRALWHARRLIDAKFRAEPRNRRLFLEILQQNKGIVHTLRLMNLLNLLPRYLPVFRRVVGQMQHDLFHAYTVDEHTLKVIRNLRRFTMAEHSEELSMANQLMSGFDRHWLLYIAALFHDIAKGRGGNHSELGAQDALAFCQDHGLMPVDAELVVFLVREHLSMSQVAQKRDLSDPNVIFQFLQTVGTERRLTALYLLTVADIRATSPTVWNSWKGKLLEDLYNLTLAALGREAKDGVSVLDQRKRDAAGEIRLAGLLDDAREDFWQWLDKPYFLRHDASEIAWHTIQLYHQSHSLTPVVRIRPAGQTDALQVLVYTKDASRLFLRICRYFDSQAVSIQDARIYTTRHGWALDSFVVMLPTYDHALRRDPLLIETELCQALQQDWLPNEHPHDHYRDIRSRRARVFPIQPTVDLRQDEQGQDWILTLSATDRRGLLYSLAQVFEHHDVRLRSAKVMTLGDRVEDVFILSGAALEQNRNQLRLERDVRLALSQQATPS
ncbi:[protein-PII] uridylyltransferase [Alcaligenes sp. AB3]|uniref:[protein-PII] uridylyltransferase n=1 Tax=Alcaligenes sp. AB3 TaxID=2962569 RepID=UPI0028818EF1|nr:[protein-PII] uridylyltransferase [Alcaligenes sp. AB3]MDT0216483.1 [protein-PII] uridylyltransferase [Alcaligenes sp. AB3]